ncbi:helix-turn-helix domain-containing protein [Streptomyces sp. AgN23]|uniref:helix-turn-helix domain-containing protein n=1 Tax=Streptomyces sp. AgN23 TaxID=1188315 RepID=UPI001B33BCE2|nr:helix-turn-helix transcriptional regulator [Streptomyces sp. AgN23]QTI88775.1 helix-turn-helix transcriptional regulator [Streptomyces sp. AgN23]WTB07169.1 helix-turn-helix domain-containing protein [Streptomyces antimycoticus]
MPDDGQDHIGARLRDIRKRRGLTQRGLSDASGISISWIRKLEQGEQQDTRLETARKLATALGVSTTRLIAGHREDDADEATRERWEPVRHALTSAASDRRTDEAPTVDGVRAALRAALPLFSGDRFAELLPVLPPLLRDAHALAGLDPRGRHLQGRLLQLTGWLMVQTRQFDTAETALARAMDEAADRLDGAAIASTRCWLLLRRGRLAEARALSVRWSDDTEPRLSRATPAELSAWGWLLLRASAAAVRDNESDVARDTLRLAHAAAVAMGREFTPDGDFLRAFGPTTVIFKRAENAMVEEEPDRVLSLSTHIPTSGHRPTSNNRNRHLLDVARAHLMKRRPADAFAVLRGVWSDAPEWLPNQRYARDILSDIIARRRTMTPEMRAMADVLGVPM